MHNHKFTGLERDSESSLDHTWFRQYTPAQGRWPSPDPAGLGAVDPGNPQGWNRYAYVLNNPLAFIDPLGLDDEPTLPNDPCPTCPAVVQVEVYSPWFGGLVSAVVSRAYALFLERSLNAHIDGGIPRGRSPRWAERLLEGTEEVAANAVSQLRNALSNLSPSLRQPGESFGTCFDRTKKALLGEAGQQILDSGSLVSLFASAATMPVPGPRLVSTGTIEATKVVQTATRVGPSILERVVATGVRQGDIRAFSGAISTARGVAGIVSKVSGVAFGVGLGVEGGFALACR